MKALILSALLLVYFIHQQTPDSPPTQCFTQSQVFNKGIAMCLYQTGSFVLDFSCTVDPVSGCCGGEIQVTDTDNVTKVWTWMETDCCTACDIPME